MSSFYMDVIKNSTLFDSVNRVSTLDLLEPSFRRKVQAILADASANGIQMMVFETYRSQARQHQLYLEGATQLKTVGVHHYGLAADIVYIHGGEPSWNGDFTILGHLARAHQLIWGGDWGTPNQTHSFRDNDHVQWCTIARQAALFQGAWYPEATYNPYSEL